MTEKPVVKNIFPFNNASREDENCGRHRNDEFQSIAT